MGKNNPLYGFQLKGDSLRVWPLNFEANSTRQNSVYPNSILLQSLSWL